LELSIEDLRRILRWFDIVPADALLDAEDERLADRIVAVVMKPE
jgi:hypothetical protein